MGNRTQSSPRDCIVQYCIAPIPMNARRTEAGPPVWREAPEATKRPVPTTVSNGKVKSHTPNFYAVSLDIAFGEDLPMAPPNAIICKWRALSSLARAVLAVFALAATRS